VSERFNKQLAVKVVEKDLLTEVSPTGQMKNRTGESQPKWPCHW
jgi:hypothetical protein